MNEPELTNTKNDRRAPFSPIAWVPLLGLLLMAVITGVLLINVVNVVKHSKFASLSVCLTWSLSVVFFAGAILVTYVTAFQVIRKELQSIKLLIGGSVLFITAGVIIWNLLPGGQELPFNENLLGGVYKFAPHAKTFVSIVQILGTVALVAIAIAVSLILSRARHDSAQKQELINKRASAIARDKNIIHKLLYVSALALIAGALQASALYSWGLAMPSENMLSDLNNFNSLKTTGIPQLMEAFNGAFYSIMLAIIFAPAFIQLGLIADRLLDEAKPYAIETERKAWFVEYALETSVPRQLLSALAILSPMLVGGPLTSLIEALSS